MGSIQIFIHHIHRRFAQDPLFLWSWSALLLRSAQMFCPSREAPLSEDMQDQSNFKAEETRRENRKMNSSEDESTRPPKHQKANTKAKEVSKPLH